MKNIYDKFIIFTVSFFIIMGNSSTIDLSGGMLYKGLPVKITDLCFLIIILKNFKLKMKKLIIKDNLILIWTLWGTVSIFLNFYIFNYDLKEIQYGILYPIRMIVYIFAVKGIAKNLSKRFSFRKIMNKINYYYTIACVIGLYQYIVYPMAYDFYNILKKSNIYILNPDPHYKRLFSTYLDPNFFGSILCIPIGLTLGEIFTARYKKRKYKKILQLLFQLMIVILTSSRSGILGSALVILIFFILCIWNKRKKMKKIFFYFYFIGGNILGLGLVLFSDKIRVLKRIIEYKSDPSAQARFNSYTSSIEHVKENFLIGTGYNMMGFYTGKANEITSFGTNSSILFIFISTGIIGLCIFSIYLIRNIYILKKYKNKVFYFNGIVAITIASVIVSNFNNLLTYPLWIIIYMLINEVTLRKVK